MKKTIGIVLSFIVLMNCFPKCYLASGDEYAQATAMAEEYAQLRLTDADCQDIVELYNFNDEIGYLYYNYGNEGYLIYELESNLIVEVGHSQNNYILSGTEIYYYNGPLSYYQKVENGFLNLKTNQVVPMEDATISKANPTNLPTTYAVVPTIETVTVQNTRFLPTYDDNDRGICGSIAAAIWLMYMDKQVNGNYVKSSLEDEAKLIANLEPRIEGMIPGSTLKDLKAGLQEYLNDTGVSHTIYGVAWNSSTYMNKINSNRPLIIGLDSDPDYGNHWVVGYGYARSTVTGALNMVIVNDGFGSMNIEINYAYIDYMVY